MGICWTTEQSEEWVNPQQKPVCLAVCIYSRRESQSMCRKPVVFVIISFWPIFKSQNFTQVSDLNGMVILEVHLKADHLSNWHSKNKTKMPELLHLQQFTPNPLFQQSAVTSGTEVHISSKMFFSHPQNGSGCTGGHSLARPSEGQKVET